MKSDFAKPFWHREQTKFRKFISNWGGFIFFITLLILSGADWK